MSYEDFNEWTAKEKFILACCVTRNGDQNWGSVSRTMKLITEACGDADDRPADWFSQKNCAKKYNELLATASSTKRKGRGHSSDAINIETPMEQVLRKLTFASIEELNRSIEAERERFKKLKSDLQKIQSGATESQLRQIWESIQSGQPVDLDNISVEDTVTEDVKPLDEQIKVETVPATAAISSALSAPSRPQRATKETEKFKSYIEQRQKHNAKYHSQQPPSSQSTPPPPTTTLATTTATSTASQVIVTSTTSTVTQSISSTEKLKNIDSVSLREESTPLASSGGLLMTKPVETVVKPPLVSPATPNKKLVETKDSLSSLLSAPTTEIKAQVNQINEILKEPVKKHHVSKESYEAYLKAQPAQGPTAAPVLSKLLGSTTSSKPTPQANFPKPSPVKGNMEIKGPVTPKKITEHKNTPAHTLTTPTKLKTETKLQNPKLETLLNAPKTPVAKHKETQKTQENTKITPLKIDVSPMNKHDSDVKSKSETSEVKVTEKAAKNLEADPVTPDVTTISNERKTDISDHAEKPSLDKDKDKEPALKKRAVEVSPVRSQEVQEIHAVLSESPIELSPKQKKKGKGRARGGTKKKSSVALNLDLTTEDDVSQSADDHEISSGSKDDVELNDDSLEKKMRLPLTPSIASPASPALSTGSNCDPEMAQQQRAWRKSIMLVWKAAASHKYANVFMHPVTDEEAPGYSSIIFKPMDLSTIKKNVETGVTTTTTEFQRDVMLMFQNALMYNRKEHDVYRMAQEMRDDVMEQIQSFISTQLMMQAAERDVTKPRGKTEGLVLGHTRQSTKPGLNFAL